MINRYGTLDNNIYIYYISEEFNMFEAYSSTFQGTNLIKVKKKFAILTYLVQCLGCVYDKNSTSDDHVCSNVSSTIQYRNLS